MGEPTRIHTRSYDCEAFDEGDGLMRVRGRLVDTKPLGLGVADGEPLEIHNMVVDLVVRVPGFEIEGVEARMDTHPYVICTDVLGDYQQLVGLSIARGFSRKVRELFGGPGGCSHVGALLQAMAPVAIQASWSLITLHEDPAQRLAFEADGSPGAAEERERRLRMNTNTCHVWAEDGPQLVALRTTGSAPRPDWEARRLRDLGVDLDSEG